MLKILLLLAVGLVVFFVVRAYRRSLVRSAETEIPVENMVRCARCGVNLPKSEALCKDDVCVCPPDQPCDRTT